MTALAADTHRDTSADIQLALPIKAATRCYQGGLIARDATGYAVPASDTAGLTVMGVAILPGDNSAGAAGDETVLVNRGQRIWIACTSAVAAWVGQDAVVLDDNTVGITSTNSIVVGKIVKIESATEVVVEMYREN